MTRLAFLIPYLGKWPHWMEFFLESVRANDQVHFWLVGAELPENLSIPPNVFTRPMDVSEIEGRLSKTFSQVVKLQDSHKLCDFRPAYGLAYQDILGEYDYWGYCDIDLLFGNLDPVLNLLESQQPDIFSGWGSHQVVGHFTIMRNADSINQIFYQIDDWEERLKKNSITFADEGGISVAISKNPWIRYSHADSLGLSADQRWPYLAVSSDYSQALVKVSESKDWLIKWHPKRLELILSDGKVVNPLYFHFMGQKSGVYWRNSNYYFSVDGELWFNRHGVANALRRGSIVRSFQVAYQTINVWSYRNLRQIASKLLPTSFKASVMRPFKKSDKTSLEKVTYGGSL